MSEKRTDHPQSSSTAPSRRRFLQAAATFGATTAALATAGGFLGSREALAQTAKEEQDRQAAAKYTMTIATAYILMADRTYPIMQLDFKENLQSLSRGKIYVKLAPGGQLGAGGALVQKVQSGTIQAAQHSLSNFAPFAPTVDLINVPYWCGENQKFVNLVTSKAWRDEVHPKVEAKGFKPLWYVCIDPRVVALRKGINGPIKTPGDLAGIKFRVPGSAILQQFYRLLGANPTPIAWGETPAAIKQGVADALDPSLEALSVFGFRDSLSWVTPIRAVPDAQVYSCNLEWFNALPADLREAVLFAAEVTSRQNLAKIPAARAFAINDLNAAGVNIYKPSDDELAQWRERAGHQRPEWDEIKTSLAGSQQAFARLMEAADTMGTYYVHDL